MRLRLEKGYILKVWHIEHKGHKIRVENSWFGGERLYVDEELQDEHHGATLRSQLSGTIKNGEGAGEGIKVSLGGWFSVGCQIFVDDKLVLGS